MITLLTDFGTKDEFAGVMKGVILSVNPCATIVDITHHIDAQDVFQAAYIIQSAYKYFPKGTIHVVVVDPGVGSNRRILAAEIQGYIFLAPDNGVLTLAIDNEETGRIIHVENSEYFLKSVSNTFHGRDIFAPVAAHISKGLDIRRLGKPLSKKDLIRLDILKPYISDNNELIGVIISVDRFGNLITNIDSDCLESFCKADMGKNFVIHIGKDKITGLSQSYAGVKHHHPLAIISSRGYLEIAVNCGDAKSYFNVEKGDMVRINLTK